MALFDIQALSFTYPEANAPALRGIDLSIAEGEFVVVCGASGCGKSTLLRQLKPALTPYGAREGSVLYRGAPIAEAPALVQAAQIGFVLQNPENQIVTDKVWHELAYGLESIGAQSGTIRLRVAEMASFFGIQGWYRKNVSELSGGQKQLLNLASIMAMQPAALILDEPTSQLDPIAATDFLATLRSINRELGTTVILSEHRLEDAFPLADRAVVMERGQIITQGAPREAAAFLAREKHSMLYAMPSPARVYFALEQGDKAPLTVREGRAFLQKYPPRDMPPQAEKPHAEAVLTVTDAWLRYEKNGADVLRDFNLSVPRGELFCIVGGNGTGKTTALFAIAGAVKAYRGRFTYESADITRLSARERARLGMAMLPQDPQTLLLCSTVQEDLLEMLDGSGMDAAQKQKAAREAAELTEITPLLQKHPYDISGGEQQRAALAKVLLTKPRLLLLDEPTKGMDSFFKRKFAGILKKLLEGGTTILMVSHDIEFCASYADRCALFFDGGIVTEGQPRAFFAENMFYTTAAGRMARGRFTGAVTVEDIAELCKTK